MRRPAPNFTVEVRRSARRTHRVATFDSDLIDAPSDDDVPSKNVHDDDDEGPLEFTDAMKQAEALLFGYEHRPIRVPPKLPHHRGFAQEHAADIETAIPAHHEETVPSSTTPPESARTGRILNSTTYVDPLEERIAAEAAEEKPARRRGRPRKEKTAIKATEPEKWPDDVAIETRAVAAPAPVMAAPAVTAAPVAVSNVRLTAPRALRAHHRVDQRILYNAWTYRVVKQKAHNQSAEVVASILKPGERWKRRLPSHAW